MIGNWTENQICVRCEDKKIALYKIIGYDWRSVTFYLQALKLICISHFLQSFFCQIIGLFVLHQTKMCTLFFRLKTNECNLIKQQCNCCVKNNFNVAWKFYQKYAYLVIHWFGCCNAEIPHSHCQYMIHYFMKEGS